MDWRLVEYAVWTMVGLWAVLFFPNGWVRLLGMLLILFAVLRALGEGTDERTIRRAGPPPAPAGEDDAAPDEKRRRPIL